MGMPDNADEAQKKLTEDKPAESPPAPATEEKKEEAPPAA